MRNAFDQFLVNIDEIKKTHLTALSISSGIGGTIINLDNIKRSCIVLCVSALDHFIHEMAVLGMLEIFNGIRAATPRYLKHNVSLDFVRSLSAMSPAAIFEAEIRKNLGWQSFQKPDKIKDAISLFSPVILWQQVSIVMHDTELNIKTQLNLIVDRRNMIAHEADIDPVYKTKRAIPDSTVSSAIDFTEKVGRSIFNVL